MATIQTQVRLPAELWEWAKEEAKRRRISKNSLILFALEAMRDASPVIPAKVVPELKTASGAVDFPDDEE